MNKWKLINGDRIYRILSGRINVYLIVTENGNILVDTGKTNGRETLISNLGRLDLPKMGIEYIIQTHTHFDHCENTKYIQEKYGCKTIASESELAFANNGYTPIPKGTNAVTYIISLLGKQIGSRRFGYTPFQIDIPVTGKLSLESRFNINIISTPGHSAGGVSIIVNNEICLVGDTLFHVFKNSIFPPYADNTIELVESWKRLLETGCHLFLPGHGAPVNRNLLEKEYLKYKFKN